MMIAAVLSCALAQDPDIEQARAVWEKYFAAMKKQDYLSAASCMHPKSLKKIRAAVVGGAEKREEKEREQVAFYFSFSSWTELMAASDATFFIHFCRNLGKIEPDLEKQIGNSEVEYIGAMKKSGLIYVVLQLTFPVNGVAQALPSLFVLYKDGAEWKMANRGETNIGK